MQLEEFVEASVRAESVEKLFELFEHTMIRLGFDRVLMALMTDHPSLHKEAEHGVMRNYPDEWVSHYLAHGYDRIDPVRHLCETQLMPFTWTGIAKRQTFTPQQEQMFNEAREAGLHQGIGIPLRGPGGAIAAVGAASSEEHPERHPQSLYLANLVVQHFYMRFWQLMEKEPLSEPSLTVREKDVLRWSAMGLTRSQIAERMSLSVCTVDYHNRNALRKLDVLNTTAAIAQALTRGLILL